MTTALDDKALQELRNQLEERQAELGSEIRRQLAESRLETHQEIAGVGDLEDQALADLLVDENLAEIHHYIREFRAIDAALGLMDRGEYGSCVDCGEVIGIDRLRAYPTAVRCIDCQARAERTQAGEAHPTL